MSLRLCAARRWRLLRSLSRTGVTTERAVPQGATETRHGPKRSDFTEAASPGQQADPACNVGMSGIQYTIRRVSPALDAELRREANETGKTLNAVVVQTLENAKLPSTPNKHDDLDWFIGHVPTDAGGEAGAQAWLDALPVEPTA